MPRNGSGTYSLPQAAFVPGTTIESAAVNSDFSDIASALTDSVAADGQTTMTGALKLADGTLTQPALTFGTSTGKGIANLGAGSMSFIYGGTAVLGINFAAYGVSGNVVVQAPNNAVLMPVGAVLDFAGTSAPAGWLLCFGQSVLRADYPELFAAIGTTYGAVDSSHFTLPDYRGRTSFGVDNMGGSTAGRITNAISGIVGTTLGATGGNQALGLAGVGLAQSDLPNVNPSISATFAGTSNQNIAIPNAAPWNSMLSRTNVAGSTSHNYATTPNDIYYDTNMAIGVGVAAPTLTPAGTVSGTVRINGNVTQTVPPVMDPAIMMNKIIFAAR